VFIDYYLLTSL